MPSVAQAFRTLSSDLARASDVILSPDRIPLYTPKQLFFAIPPHFVWKAKIFPTSKETSFSNVQPKSERAVPSNRSIAYHW